MTNTKRRSKGRVWRFAEFEFHEVSRKLFAHGIQVPMENKPREALRWLLERPQEICSVSYLLDAVWPDVATGPDSVMTAIAKLRKAFGEPIDRIISNVSGEGYRMAIPVSCSIQAETVAELELTPGDEMPRRPGWQAKELLSHNDASPVWLARHVKTGEHRIFKFALDGVRLRALQREFTVYRLLTGSLGEKASFLVRIVGSSFDELPAFLESAASGQNLLAWSGEERFRKLSLEDRVQLAADVATSMAKAHQLAVFHNDLKPSNLLVSGMAGPSGTRALSLLIADFGSASLAEPGLLHEMDISDPGNLIAPDGSPVRLLGTEMYRAPEWRSGATPTAQNDIYAVGVLMYQLACGNFLEPPLPGWEGKIADSVLRADIEDAANVDPAKRIRTMDDLAARLRNFERRRKENERQLEADVAMQQMEQSLRIVHARRPWVRLALVCLMFGLLASAWTTYRIWHEQQAVRKANATLEQMYAFLAKDVLGQSNPYLRVTSSSDVAKQTLVEAVDAAVPQIDARFSKEPFIAGRLRETIADTYKDRTRFRQADQEYEAAARNYRTAEGDLSQAAIIVELKREFSDLASMRPGSMRDASVGFQQQEARIKQVEKPSATLQAWETLIKTTLLGMGPHPEQTIGLIDTAVHRAEVTLGFDPVLLLRLKKLYCGTYVRLGDGMNLERVSKEIISELTRMYGATSAMLFPYQMYLEEAYYLQGKYPETVAQADANFTRFQSLLGDKDQLTIATLATRAAAEGQMEQYGNAVRDDMALHSAAQAIGDRRLEIGSLNDAANYECREGSLSRGTAHAREVMRDAGPGPMSQPMFYNGSMFTLAECLLASQEEGKGRPDAEELIEVGNLLTAVDVRQMAEISGDTAYEGARDVAMARLALLKGAPAEAERYLRLAAPLVKAPHADPFEQHQMDRVESVLKASARH